MRSELRKLRANKKLKKVLIVFGWASLAFVIANLLLALIFNGKTYPGTTVQNQKVGTKSRGSLQSELTSIKFLPEQYNFVYQDKAAEVKTGDLGIEVDTAKTAEQAIKQKKWLPFWNLIKPAKVGVVLKADSKKYDEQIKKLAEEFKKDPVNARIALENNKFSIKSEESGYELDSSNLLEAVQSSQNQDSAKVSVPVRVTQAQVKQSDLMANTKDLEERLGVSIIYKFGDKTRKLTPDEIANLHEPSGSLYVLSEGKLKDFIVKVGGSFGIGIANINDAVRDSKTAIQNKKPLEFTFKEAPRKTYTYCVSLRGVDASELSGFQNKIAAVLNDARGWSIDNRVSFVKVDSGCNFRMWLSAASQMSSFGAICDADWSCAVSPNVVVNYDRWRFASTAWNQSGGSLDDYRSMVINHEVGHWLGFGHYNCGGAGQLAPVMQQQSINLQGCKFNPWPLASERDSLKRIIGI